MNTSIKNTLTTLSLLLTLGITIFSCSNSNPPKKEEEFDASKIYNADKEANSNAAKAAQDAKGIGKFTNVELGAKLDTKMADAGKSIYDVKCSSCHRLTEEKLVGPGWKDVTKRRTAEWVMNFSTNPDEMLDKDAIAKGMLEECLVRMPNQGLSDDDARHIYEYMRQNDGVN
jgi:cytochrome c551/c552